MYTFFIRVLIFPVDLMRLSLHLAQLSGNFIQYRLLYHNVDQPCCFCQEGDNGRCPRPLPRQLRKYRNPEMICVFMPCLRKQKARRTPDSPVRSQCMCHGEGGYLRLRCWVVWGAMGLGVFWVGLSVWVFCWF